MLAEIYIEFANKFRFDLIFLCNQNKGIEHA